MFLIATCSKTVSKKTMIDVGAESTPWNCDCLVSQTVIGCGGASPLEYSGWRENDLVVEFQALRVVLADRVCIDDQSPHRRMIIFDGLLIALDAACEEVESCLQLCNWTGQHEQYSVYIYRSSQIRDDWSSCDEERNSKEGETAALI